MTTTTNLNELGKQIHENAKAKGFWDEPRNTGEIFMLIVSELSEALEADRKGRVADMDMFQSRYSQRNGVRSTEMLAFIYAFENEVKDTVEDEIADVVIRILGYCAVQKIDADFERFDDLDSESHTKNVGEYLISITGSVYYASVSARALDFKENEDDRDNLTLEIHEALAKLFGFAESRGFDLCQHIQLKMKYNATREHKHGKKY